MTRKGFRNVSLKNEVHDQLTEVANILKKTRPDAVKELVDCFLRTREKRSDELIIEGGIRERERR